MKKFLVAGLVSLGSMGLLIGTATAAGATGNLNMALSITGGPWHVSQHSAFQIDNNAGLVVGDANRAEAVSSHCVNCKTVAAAFQVDLASGPVTAIRAVNKAVATTIVGVNADTCAAAYQFIVSPNEQVVFTPAAKTALNAVAASVNAEVKSADSCDVIDIALAGDADAVVGILSDPGSYTPGTPGLAPPTLNVNQYQDNESS